MPDYSLQFQITKQSEKGYKKIADLSDFYKEGR